MSSLSLVHSASTEVRKETSVLSIISAILFFILLFPSVLAAEVKSEQASNNDSDEIQIEDEGIKGLVVDHTVTFIGRRFYNAFSIAWLDYQVGQGENFSIHEQPTAISGSRIWIEHNRKKLFQVFLSPVLANIVGTARKAAKSVSSRFETLQLERVLFNNPDLAADEF